MDYLEKARGWVEPWLATLLAWMREPAFYGQVAFVAGAILLARIVAALLLRRVPLFREEPGEGRFNYARKLLFQGRDLLRPLLAVAFLGIGIQLADVTLGSSWLIRAAQSLSLAFLLYSAIRRFIANPLLRSAGTWIGVPAAVLWAFGWLDDVILWLDSAAISVGNIRVSALFLMKGVIAGAFFFWLGRHSNDYGQKMISRQEAIDPPTRELFSKLFEIALFALIGILLMQVLRLDLTALAIFGGALGVGLGFGLQQIAANFISGIILLLERSMGAGDYIELEDGRAGLLAKINMRSSVLKTFDGKEILVPNEKFITSRFVNWTREDPRQRFEVGFFVPYGTDLDQVKELVDGAVGNDPRVLSDPEPPQTEIRRFGEYRIAFAVTFWVKGLDDGPNRFSSDISFLIWRTLSGAGIPMSAKPMGPKPGAGGAEDEDGPDRRERA